MRLHASDPLTSRMSTGATSNLTLMPVAGSSPGRFDDQFTLRDAGVLTPIELGGQVRSHSVNFSLSEMELTQKASLHLYYHLAATQTAQSGSVRVLLNSTEVATLTVPRAVDRAALLEQEIALPADLLVHQNQLTFAYGGQPCPSPADLAPWSSIEPETRLSLSGSLLAIPSDLTRLPLPFLDPSSLRRSSVPVVFAVPPSPEALEAAGIVASYFGMLADNHQLLFPVSIGKLPPGNVILIAESAALLPPGLALSGIASPTVAVRPNPSDPAGKVLVAVLALPFARIAHGQSTVEQEVVQKARSLESRGLTDLAAQTWQQVLLSQPDNTDALAGLARMAKKQGKNAEAARYLDRLRQINPKDPQIAVIESTVTEKLQSGRQAQAESLAAAGNYAGPPSTSLPEWAKRPFNLWSRTSPAVCAGAPPGGPLTFSFSRDSIKDTQLSYSGLRDPGSATASFDGNIWGGVIANTGDVQVARGDALSGFYAGVGGQYIAGRHVLDNTQLHGNAGAYWRVLTLPDLGTLVLGANFFGMHYAHNLRYFTYGQGGYFSPEAYFLAAMPLSWTGHYGPDLHYTVTGSIGGQSFQENSEPYFPLDPRLQAAFGGPLVPVTASVGVNYDLQSEMAYPIQDHWYVGAFSPSTTRAITQLSRSDSLSATSSVHSPIP